MRMNRESGVLAGLVLLIAGVGYAQTPAAAPPVDPAKQMATMQKKLDDWPQLGRYAAENAALAAPAVGEQAGGVLWGFDYGWLGAQAEYRNVLSGQALCEPGDQRADDSADGGAIPAGCDRPEARGGGDPGGYERRRRQYGSDDSRDDDGELRFDDRSGGVIGPYSPPRHSSPPGSPPQQASGRSHPAETSPPSAESSAR